MYFLYWFLKLGWLVLIIFTGNIYLSSLGIWSVVIGIALFLVGNSLINKKVEPLLKKNS
ncbi:hypothetical protein J1P26_08225 [Neobacillus sp. MM2021_6]|uniref:hypothetical protein n=1 Tax=Bacillaceae TaxID=186817 RepID=UPI00140854DD|nr:MULTISPECIES: hypothetical protein [Bacillaceae]MBO0959707.1 hypothetical protein [Neobacillus sp. MM2021_6]NHC19213.1 hypothetical protein [Bacillus sp. MM2020_4]